MVEVSEGREDKEEQLLPHQKRRTSPRRPSTEVIAVSPSPPSTHTDASEEHFLLEVQEASKSVPTVAEAKRPTENSGLSWLQPGFEMPTKVEALRDLVDEISSRTPPLNNIRFTNRFTTSYLRGTILNRAVDVDSLASMSGMGMDEATNRVGSLLAQVLFKLFFSSMSVFLLSVSILDRFSPTSSSLLTLILQRKLSTLQLMKSGGLLMNPIWLPLRLRLLISYSFGISQF